MVTEYALCDVYYGIREVKEHSCDIGFRWPFDNEAEPALSKMHYLAWGTITDDRYVAVALVAVPQPYCPQAHYCTLKS